MEKNYADSDYPRSSAVFKKCTVLSSRGSSVGMSLYNHIGSVKPGDLVQVYGQYIQSGDTSYWPGCEDDTIMGGITGVYLQLTNRKTGSCEVLIAGRVRSFYHPGISVQLITQGSRI